MDFQTDLVKKKDSFRTMMLDIESSERKEREVAPSDLEMTLIDKLYYQQHTGSDSVDERLVQFLVRHDAMSRYEMPIEPCNKFVDECLNDSSIIMSMTEAINEAMTEDSIIDDNLEDMTNSCLEIERLMREPDSEIEDVVDSAYHVKDEIKISVKFLRKALSFDNEDSERTLGATSQRRTRMYRPSLVRNYSIKHGVSRHKILDEHFCIDTFLSIDKDKNSSKENECLQLFSSGK